jgi:hypothetical protein
MQKNSWWLIILLIILVSALILRIGTPRNRWVCEGGEWIKKGNPSSPQPSESCFNEYSIEDDIKELSELFANKEMSGDNEKEDQTLSEEELEKDLELKDSLEGEKDDKEKTPRLVQLISPQEDEVMRSPYQVSGFVSGTWYFEASFPVILRASDGTILAETYAEAQSDWMTEDLVPFISELVFDSGDYVEGELVIIKDNPSGLPEYDAQVVYPVRFVSEIYED